MATDDIQEATKKDLREVEENRDTDREDVDDGGSPTSTIATRIRKTRGKIRERKGRAKSRKLKTKRKIRRKTKPVREVTNEVKLLASELGVTSKQAKDIASEASDAIDTSQQDTDGDGTPDASTLDEDNDGDTDILRRIEQQLDQDRMDETFSDFESPVPNDNIEATEGLLDESFLNGLDPSVDFEEDLDAVGGKQGSIEDELGL